MTSRERIVKAINHEATDRVPLDLGSTGQTGISASSLYALRQALGLPVKEIEIIETFQLLGKVDDDVLDAVGADVVGLWNPTDMFGNQTVPRTQKYRLCDGTPVLLPDSAKIEIREGQTYMFPQGDNSVPPSAKIPAGGYFFDNIDRASAFDEENLTPADDFKDCFGVADEPLAKYWESESIRLANTSDRAVIGNLGGGGLGDNAVIPGPGEKAPRGIRKIEDWLMAHILYPEYIETVFDMQTQAMIKNLEIYKQAVGDRIQIVWISGTDFGTQNGEMIHPDIFRKLYKPFYTKINNWVHANTKWKTFYHSCGSIVQLLDDFVEMGVDILNPVQLSAKGMDAKMLKDKYGAHLTFWGGGVDTQHTLPNGTPEEVAVQVRDRIKILSRGGGYVFNPIHNIVARVPVENLIAMYQAVKNSNMQE